MIILIDNYDSFTFNIYHYLSEVGAKIEVIRNDKISSKELYKMKPQAIVLSPGPKTPNEAGICLDIIRENINTPLLGICLGHQSIGQAYGSKITLCKEIMHGKIDTIYHKKHKIFKGIKGSFKATRYHSLIINRDNLSSELEIIAETNTKIIMGIAHKYKKIFGLQFHPESIGSENGKLILQNFLNIIKYGH